MAQKMSYPNLSVSRLRKKSTKIKKLIYAESMTVANRISEMSVVAVQRIWSVVYGPRWRRRRENVRWILRMNIQWEDWWLHFIAKCINNLISFLCFIISEYCILSLKCIINLYLTLIQPNVRSESQNCYEAHFVMSKILFLLDIFLLAFITEEDKMLKVSMQLK